MKELVGPVDLCARGGLNPDAIGWSRRPLHRCNLARGKHWNWWCVTDERWYLCAVVARLEYGALGLVSLMDLDSGQTWERLAPWISAELPETVDEPARFSRLGVELELGERLRMKGGPLRAEIELAPARDSLSTVIPGRGRFWYTSKHVGRPARGVIRLGGRIINIDGWAALDFGRGLWPVRTRWNWAVGVRGQLAFNLGARWTDGTGATENGLIVDGKLHKIQSEVRFGEDFSIRGPDVELRFRPKRPRNLGLPPWLGLRWCAGWFDGRILDQKIESLFGWAEALDILW
jgi:hypothetical protein